VDGNGYLSRDAPVGTNNSQEYIAVLSSTSNNGYEYMHGNYQSPMIRDFANSTDFWIMSEDVYNNEWALTGYTTSQVHER
jgi:hypothetical protein